MLQLPFFRAERAVLTLRPYLPCGLQSLLSSQLVFRLDGPKQATCASKARTVRKDGGLATNRRQLTANHGRLTANWLCDREEENVPVTVRFCWQYEAQNSFL